MTPSEAVDLICEMALNDLEKEDRKNRIKEFIPHCLELDLLFQKKQRDPYFLNSSF